MFFSFFIYFLISFPVCCPEIPNNSLICIDYLMAYSIPRGIETGDYSEYCTGLEYAVPSICYSDSTVEFQLSYDKPGWIKPETQIRIVNHKNGVIYSILDFSLPDKDKSYKEFMSLFRKNVIEEQLSQGIKPPITMEEIDAFENRLDETYLRDLENLFEFLRLMEITTGINCKCGDG